jgi:hypothetical protein
VFCDILKDRIELFQRAYHRLPSQHNLGLEVFMY